MKLYSHSAETRAPPDVAARVIISADGLKKWFGNVQEISADGHWPANGARMRWKAMGTLFECEVDLNELPNRIVLDTTTPSGRSVVTHLFEEIETGGTKYTKTVDVVESRGFFGLLLPFILPGAVRKEVERAVKVADEAAASKA